jgi:hypothetical protein
MLVIVAACASPDRATAGCGDYVTILNGTSAGSHQDGPTEPGGPQKAPCQGPNCSGDPVRHQAPLAPAAPVAPQVKEVAGTIDGPASEASLRFLLHIDSSSARPISRPSSVFHPPRIG